MSCTHGRSAQPGSKLVYDLRKAGRTAQFIAADLADPDDAFFDEHVSINLRGPYILVQKFVPRMAARGGGAVVNLSTVAASVPGRDAEIYCATKAGLEQLTRLCANEFGGLKVRINAVADGPTKTPGTAANPGLADDYLFDAKAAAAHP